MKIKHYGTAGHFIGGNQCRFHLCTEVGDYLVSTVGEYDPAGESKEMRAILKRSYDEAGDKNCIKIGCDRFYETMVFKTKKSRCACGCGVPNIVPNELDFEGYDTAGEATKGHFKMVEKWSEKYSEENAPVDLE